MIYKKFEVYISLIPYELKISEDLHLNNEWSVYHTHPSTILYHVMCVHIYMVSVKPWDECVNAMKYSLLSRERVSIDWNLFV